MVDEADERAIEKMTGQDRGKQSGQQTGAPIEHRCCQRPDGEHRQDADNSRSQSRNAFDVVGGRIAPVHQKRDRRGGRIEQRRNGDVLPVRRRKRIKR